MQQGNQTTLFLSMMMMGDKTKVMQAAAASIKVLRPGGHWRIAVPDAYFPKYFKVFN